MTGSFPLTIETPDAIATQVLNVLFYGLPIEELQSFRQRVNAVTPDDIERVARFYLRPDRLSIVLVGNASAFTSQLRRVGFGTFELIETAESGPHGRRTSSERRRVGSGQEGQAGALTGRQAGRPEGRESAAHVQRAGQREVSAARGDRTRGWSGARGRCSRR